MEARSLASSILPSTTDDGLLHALLSFECLAARAPIVEFLSNLVGPDPEIAELLLEAFSQSFEARSDSQFAAYRPVTLSVVQRHANWSANLVLLAAVAAGPNGITASRLFAKAEKPATEWRNAALLWRGQLTDEGQNGLMGFLGTARLGHGHSRDILVQAVPYWEETVPKVDLSWVYNTQEIRGVYFTYDAEWMRHKDNFTAVKAVDLLEHGIEPIAEMVPAIAHTIVRLPDGRLVTAMHALLAVLAALGDPYQARGTISDLMTVMKTVDDPRLLPSEEASIFSTIALGTLLTATFTGLVPEEFYPEIYGLASSHAQTDTHDVAREHLTSALSHLKAYVMPPTAPTPPTPEASPPPEPSPTTSSPETPATPPAAP